MPSQPEPSPPESRQPDPQRRSERSRRAILDATLDLCAEHGYGPVTVEAIAARAGVSKKTIYRWWPSKGAVVLEALHEAADPVSGFPDTGDLRADLLTQMEALLRGLLGSPRFGRALIGLIADTHHNVELAHGLQTVLFQPRIDDGRARLAKAREAGQISPDADLDLAMELLYGPVYYRLLLHQGDLHGGTELESLVDHALRALAP
ncbi:TetR/AcrR family transcriptional regulator [Streptomyces albiaxialis]|uniref:TetR/AcrR family transcriptional regulator n=1 Tax=Streptomyces albiaxialis TaxID=329523 RepID=A0ABP5HZF7_9ACTN